MTLTAAQAQLEQQREFANGGSPSIPAVREIDKATQMVANPISLTVILRLVTFRSKIQFHVKPTLEYSSM